MDYFIRLLHNFLWLLWLPIFLITANAHSYPSRDSELRHLSIVSEMSISGDPTGESVSVELKIPHHTPYGYHKTRWYVMADPNARAELLEAWGSADLRNPSFHSFRSGAARDVFDFILRNQSCHNSPVSLEMPSDFYTYKLVLRRNADAAPPEGLPVSVLNAEGELEAAAPQLSGATVFRGEAFRVVRYLHPVSGQEAVRHVPVGWARAQLRHNAEFGVALKAAFRVADPSLGTVPSIYYVDDVPGFLIHHKSAGCATLDLLNRTLEAHKGRGCGPNGEVAQLVWRDVDQDRRFDEISELIEPSERSGQSRRFDFLFRKSKRDTLPDSVATYKQYLAKYGNSAPHKPHKVYPRQETSTVEITLTPSATDTDSLNTGISASINLADSIGDSSGCPHVRQVVRVGIAVDCNYMQLFGSSEAVRDSVISIVNTASEQYERSFNVSLGLAQLVLANGTDCPLSASASAPWNYACAGSSDGQSIPDRLQAFSTWRSRQTEEAPIGVWGLLTTCADTSIVGLAWVGTLCNDGSGGAAGTAVVAHTQYDWKVLAHEFGHVFGAVHDCVADTCAEGLAGQNQCCPDSAGTCDSGGSFIMAPSTGADQTEFSLCTQGNICNLLGTGYTNSTCLSDNRNVALLDVGQCGNGIVEEGEECDCGGSEACKAAGNTCCDPDTCRLRSEAECDDENDACCSGCRFASSETICRASRGPCDPAEYCPGNSSACPVDVTTPDGTKCTIAGKNGEFECASGICTSRDLQCLDRLGNGTFTSDGSALDIIGACDTNGGCSMSCRAESHSGMCFLTGESFADGTRCYGSGYCKNGECIGGSGTGNGIFTSGWWDKNKPWVIGVAAGFGALLLLLVLWSWFKAYRRQRALASVPLPKPVQPVQTVPIQPGNYNYYYEQPMSGPVAPMAAYNGLYDYNRQQEEANQRYEMDFMGRR